MAKYTPEVRYIASIFPGKLERITLYHGPDPDPTKGRATVYFIEPVEKGSRPIVIEVRDAFENVFNIFSGKNDQVKQVDVSEIVQNLLRLWTGNMADLPQGSGPGIMEISRPEPSARELREMNEKQTAYFEYLFSEGQKLYKQNDWKGITETMRVAANYLGRPQPWSDFSIGTNVIDCPACRQTIPDDSLVCRHCGTRLKALPASLAQLNQPRTATVEATT